MHNLSSPDYLSPRSPEPSVQYLKVAHFRWSCSSSSSFHITHTQTSPLHIHNNIIIHIIITIIAIIQPSQRQTSLHPPWALAFFFFFFLPAHAGKSYAFGCFVLFPAPAGPEVVEGNSSRGARTAVFSRRRAYSLLTVTGNPSGPGRRGLEVVEGNSSRGLMTAVFVRRLM